MHALDSRATFKRPLSLLIAAIAAASLLAALAASASAAVPTIPQNVPLKLKFKSSGMVANIKGGSNQTGAPLIQWDDVSGFTNDDFKFTKANATVFGPNAYVVQPVGVTSAGSPLYVKPAGFGPSAFIVQNRPPSPSSVWRVEASEDPGYVHLVNHVTGLAMNVRGNSMNRGASIIQWPQQFTPAALDNDDIRILPAS